MWIVYLIQNSATQELYVGKTNNLERRLYEHNQNKQKSTARTLGTWMLIYAEAYRNKQDADERERMLKHHGSSKKGLYGRIKRSMLDN
jgi:putative endonuclease